MKGHRTIPISRFKKIDTGTKHRVIKLTQFVPNSGLWIEINSKWYTIIWLKVTLDFQILTPPYKKHDGKIISKIIKFEIKIKRLFFHHDHYHHHNTTMM